MSMVVSKKAFFSKIAKTIFILISIWLGFRFIRYHIPNVKIVKIIASIASILLILCQIYQERARKIWEFCFRYRWIIALVLFSLCLVFRIHGSSIGAYDEIFTTQINTEETTLFGKPRWIRSDEFGVSTMKYFSQSANNYKFYSNQMSLSPTNMVLDYYSPVWDWTILGKPMSWGFLLFGNEIGLSWYWCSLQILLFMTALEMCFILTNGMRMEALLGAFMIAFSPAIQWWVMPHMPPVIMYAMALFVVSYWFFTANGKLARWSSSILTTITLIGFILSIFPAFQVPCGYTVVILLAVCLWRDKEKITFTKCDWLSFTFPITATAPIVGRFVYISLADFYLLLNTVYPGPRLCLGGGYGISSMFTDFSSLFLPYKDITFANNCEVSTYIHFAPFFMLLMPRLSFVQDKENKQFWVGRALFWILIAFFIYMFVGIPVWLAKISMMRFCNRIQGVYGWVATLFTVWGFSLLSKNNDLLSKREKILWPVAYGVFSLLLLNDNLHTYFAQFVFKKYSIGTFLPILSSIAFTIILLLAVKQQRRLMCSLMVIMMLFAGGTVNPIERGIGAVLNHPISKKISEISKNEPDSLWICAESVFIISNFAIANGAKVLSATNFYPDLKKWEIIDPDGAYNEIFNRYANIDVDIIEGKNSIQLKNVDYIKINLNPETIKKLNIKYVITTIDHTELFKKYAINCEELLEQDGYRIYLLTY